ncbi:hypothetical protein Ahy_B05g074630 isoform A [Arachis hypogaea]|uniref:RING-type domain-containing protein n=1 Tax=Arachis hypogaea TaxID=3818 RepID=A0A444YZC6_ARAHY|nr:hypothetical protein Ahy_B05g074630 isoform A [Arachis hypogaea]
MHDAVYKKYTMFNLSLLISPASLPCSHVFCNFCIVKSMKSSSDCPKLLVVIDELEALSLISLLEEVNYGKLKHEENLAFQINVHNALVMHVRLIIILKRIKLLFSCNTLHTFVLFDLLVYNVLIGAIRHKAINVHLDFGS